MPQVLLEVFQVSAIVISSLMLLVWGISLVKKDASIIDIAWGLGFVLVAWCGVFTTSNPHANWLLILIITLWGLRLSAYLAWRNHGLPEDYRYQKMRKRWGKNFPLISLFTVFCLQGVVMWIVSLPVQVGVALYDGNFGMLFVCGLLVWLVGFGFEALADWQMLQFKYQKDNDDQVLNSGLWKYSRHPNYFGDFLVWWGIYLVCISQTSSYWTVISPMVMSLCLMKISGVTLLEKTLSVSKPKYNEYQKVTNAFFPGRPKSS